MSFTYVIPVVTDVHTIRLRLQDTDPCDYILEDEEIESYLTLYGSVTMALIQICFSLSAKFAVSSYEELEVDDIRIKEGKDKAKRFLDLAKALTDLINSGLDPDNIPTFMFGGVYQTELDANKQAQINGTIKCNPFTSSMYNTF